MPQRLALRRTETHDELWSACLDEKGRVATIPRAGTPKAAASRLFKELVRSMVGYSKPVEWREGDLLGKAAYTQAHAQIEQGIE